MSDYLPIALCVLWGLFELFGLAKDWTAHKRLWRRVLVILLIIGITVLTGINIRKSEIQIAGLREAVNTANQNQKDNTKLFVDVFGKIGDDIHKLSQDVSDLRTQRNTAEFQKKADQLKADLEAQAKLVAELKAKFEAKAGFKTDATPIPLKVQKVEANIERHMRDLERLDSQIRDVENQIKQLQLKAKKEISEASGETDIRKSVDRMKEAW
jgi:predicted  nucleic acid-binding Zn-ribbon protein